MSGFLTLGSFRQGDRKVKLSQDYVLRPYLRKQTVYKQKVNKDLCLFIYFC